MTFSFDRFLNFKFWKIIPKNNLDSKLLFLLENDSLHTFKEILDSGYTPNDNILKLYDEKINHLITNHEEAILSSLFGKEEYFLSPSQFATYFKNYKLSDSFNKYRAYSFTESIDLLSYNAKKNNKSENEIYNDEKLRNVIKEYKERLGDDVIVKKHINKFLENDYQQAILNDFIDSTKRVIAIKNKKLEYKDYSLFQIINLWNILDVNTFSKTNMETYTLLKSNMMYISNKLGDDMYGKAFKAIYNNLDYNMSKVFKNDINNLINEAKLSSFSEMATKKALSKHTELVTSQFSVKSLPNESVQYIDEIKNTYTNIIKHNTSLNEVVDSNKIINERLPKVINTYLSMEPEYRTSMKNTQGKSAQDLLLESLQSIQELLHTNLSNIQHDNLKDLSAQNRFLKNKGAL